jgi:uncharacterized RDD family membrane protein YckC
MIWPMTQPPYGQPYSDPSRPQSQPQPPYAQPYAAPTGQPYTQPYGAPPGQPYGAPPGQPYGAPPGQPYNQPYGTPTGQPYTQPYGAPAGYRPPPGSWQPPTPGGQPLAEPGWRLLARILDGFIVFLISAPILVPLYIALFKHTFDQLDKQLAATSAGQPPPTVNVYDGTTFKLYGLILLTAVGVSFLYEVIQLAQWGQTLGKRVCHVRVVRKDGREKLGFGKAFVRWFVGAVLPFTPFVGLIFSLLNDLWLLWDKPWRQCLHDKAASTIVVKV